MLSISGRRGKRLQTATALLALSTGAGLLAAQPAAAKSDLDLHANRTEVAVGATVRVTASGDSDDFGGDTLLLCVDERSGTGPWRTLSCTSAATLHVQVRPARAGSLAFRAQLLAEVAPGRTTVDRTSDELTVRVR